MGNHVLYEKKGKKAFIILNKPEKLNTLDLEMYDDVYTYLKEAEADEEVRVVILKGAGRCFSAGYDIEAETNSPFKTPMDERNMVHNDVNALRWRIWDMGKPVICQIHGYCLGGATDLMLPADYVITSDDCKIGSPQIQFGGAPVYLMAPWLTGIRKGKELMLTGEKISGKEAAECGLVTKSMPAEELDDYVEKLANKLILMPAEILAVQKWGINKQFEVMGIKAAMDAWEDYSMFFRYMITPEIEEFNRIAGEKGTKVALKWREDYEAGKVGIGEI